jgi:hypothetical protein
LCQILFGSLTKSIIANNHADAGPLYSSYKSNHDIRGTISPTLYSSILHFTPTIGIKEMAHTMADEEYSRLWNVTFLRVIL